MCAWDASRTLPMALGGSGGSNGSGKVFGVQFHPESAGAAFGFERFDRRFGGLFMTGKHCLENSWSLVASKAP